MSALSTAAPASGTLASVQRTRQQISQRIKEIERQLEVVEKVPSTQPWTSSGHITDIKDLRTKSRNLRQALEQDLRLLKEEMKRLGVEAKGLERKQARRQADKASHDFEKRAKETLKGDGSGGMSEKQLDAVREEAEDVLERYTDILDSNPNEGNARNVLRHMETPYASGSSSDGGACARAWNSLGRAARVMEARAAKNFRKNPTVENFEKKLKSWEFTLTTGGEPTERPAGWKPANTTHIVGPGDSLAGISKRYYKDPGYWDIIYLANVKAVGNPRHLILNTVLKIP
jgi:nucleoid-associated protein YgaU